MHQTIANLSIFVSGRVATKEDTELVQCMDLIDLLPPGLYEAVITDAEFHSGWSEACNKAATACPGKADVEGYPRAWLQLCRG